MNPSTKMKPDFFKFLPPEIITNILLKLSVRSVAVSKCVCKSWLHLLESDDFVTSHFAQSAPAIALTTTTEDSNWLKLFELEEEELDLDLGSHDQLTSFAFPYDEASIEGSANGLLFLLGYNSGYQLYICNPITREFIELFCRGVRSCGFGVSRISGQHKAVSVYCRYVDEDRRYECHVYTLGTGFWRLVEAKDSSDCFLSKIGAFVHGNLHWMMSDCRDGIEWISCFDLETERFSRFTVPPPLEEDQVDRELYSLRDSLAFCDGLLDGGVVIWMMKEYGVEKSWTKEYVIDLGIRNMVIQWFQPIKVFENGDVLLRFDGKFFYYSKRCRTSRKFGALSVAGEDEFDDSTSVLHTPSMVSLKSLAPMENVISF